MTARARKNQESDADALMNVSSPFEGDVSPRIPGLGTSPHEMIQGMVGVGPKPSPVCGRQNFSRNRV